MSWVGWTLVAAGLFVVFVLPRLLIWLLKDDDE